MFRLLAIGCAFIYDCDERQGSVYSFEPIFALVKHAGSMGVKGLHVNSDYTVPNRYQQIRLSSSWTPCSLSRLFSWMPFGRRHPCHLASALSSSPGASHHYLTRPSSVSPLLSSVACPSPWLPFCAVLPPSSPLSKLAAVLAFRLALPKPARRPDCQKCKRRSRNGAYLSLSLFFERPGLLLGARLFTLRGLCVFCRCRARV